jgi:hypothetical protein
MTSKHKHTEPDVEVGGTIIKDFLPSPDQLAFREEAEPRITITMTKSTVDFFKREATKRGAKYQTMMRKLLDSYAQAHSVKARKAVV